MSLRDKLNKTKEEDRKLKAGRVREWRWPSGSTKFRILPGLEDREDFFRDFALHWIKDADNKVVAAVPDVSIIGTADTCPVREALGQMRRYAQATDDEGLEKKVNEFLASHRRIVNVEIIDTNGEKPSEPVIVSFSITQFGQLMEIIETLLDEVEEDDGSITPENDPVIGLKTGRVFKLTKTGSGFDTKYTIMATGKASAVTDDYVGQATSLTDFIDGQTNNQKTAAALSQISVYLGRPVDQDLIEGALTDSSSEQKAIGSSDSTSMNEVLDDEIPTESSSVTKDDAVADDDAQAEYADMDDDILSEIDRL